MQLRVGTLPLLVPTTSACSQRAREQHLQDLYLARRIGDFSSPRYNQDAPVT